MADDTPAWVRRTRFRLDRDEPYLSLGHVTVFVSDYDRALRFYVEQLGFSVMYDVPLPNGIRFVGVAPPDGAAFLALVVPPAGTAEHDLIGRNRHVVLVTEDVLGTYERWRRRGVA